jgi:hypothetical protein
VAGDRAYDKVDVAAHVGQSQADTWHVLIGKKKGATWPTQGLPRGTPSLAVWFNVKLFGLARRGFEHGTSGQLHLNNSG